MTIMLYSMYNNKVGQNPSIQKEKIMAEMVLLNSDVEYVLVDRVCRAYQKIKSNPSAYDLAASMVYDEKSVAEAIANHAKDLNLDGVSAEHVIRAMQLSKNFAGAEASNIEALNALVSNPEAYKSFQNSANVFRDNLDKAGKTILDSKHEYANLIKLVDAYADVSSRLGDFGLNSNSSLEEWKTALKNYPGLNITNAEFEKAFLNAGKVLSNKQTGVNALESLFENKEPIANSYNRFGAQKSVELDNLNKTFEASKKDFAESKKANNKAHRTVIGTILGQAAMLIAIPASIGGLFAGAAAVAGGMAALTSVASVGIVLTTGMLGLVGFAILKKPFMKLLGFLGGKRAAAKALLNGDENTLGSKKNRKKMRGLFKSNRMAYEKCNAKLNSIAKTDEEALNRVVAKQPLNIKDLEGLSVENQEKVALRQTVEQSKEHSEMARVPEMSDQKVDIDAKRNTQKAIEKKRANTFFNVSKEESRDLIASNVDAYVEKLCDEYQKANPGKTIPEAEKERLKAETLSAYGDYFDYKDRKVTSRFSGEKRKEKEIAKLLDSEVYVGVEDENKNISSASIKINVEELANQINNNAAVTSEKNAEERKIRSDMQETYDAAINGSKITHEVVDARLAEIAKANGVDYNSLKEYYDAELNDKKRYSHAGVIKANQGKDGEAVELSNEELVELSNQIKPIVELGKETNERLAKIDADRAEMKEGAGQYKNHVNDQFVSKTVDAMVEKRFADASQEQKQQLAAEVKAYYTAEKPYETGKVEVMTLDGVAAKLGTSDQAIKDAMREEIDESVQAALQENAALQQDRQRMEELNKFHKACAEAGLATPDGIVTEFLKKVESDYTLQDRLGEEKVAELKSLVAKNAEIAQDVEKYAKDIPSSEKAQHAMVRAIMSGAAFDNKDLRYILDVCYSDYMPYREQQRQAMIEQVKLKKEQEEAEKLAKKAAKKEKHAKGKEIEAQEQEPGSEE